MKKENKKRLDVFADEYIGDSKKVDHFLMFCATGCGWLENEEIDQKTFETCLENFKKQYPELL